MQAILLATGETNKLRPLTDSLPSPLIPIANRPVMEIAVETLVRHGVKNIIVCIYHQANAIEQRFKNGRRWGAQIQYVLVREAWGNAGALWWAKPLITEDFIVTPADAFVDYNVTEAIDHHCRRQNLATAVVSNTESCMLPADAPLGPRMLENLLGLDPLRAYYETGVYIFNPQIFDYIPEQTAYDIHTQLLPRLFESQMPVGAYVMDGYWNPLDTFRQIQMAQKVYLDYSIDIDSTAQRNKHTFRYPFIFAHRIAPGVWVGKNNSIHPSVRLCGPVLLGDNIRIDKDAIIGPDVVIGHNVIVSEEATINSSTILPDTFVGQLVYIENRLVDQNLVIDYHSSAYLHIQDRFLLRRTPNSLEHSIYGRSIGAVAALISLILAAPLILLIALILKIQTGRAFVSLPRIGFKPSQAHPTAAQSQVFFYLHQFNINKADGSPTGFGRILERFELHRLPELWNLLKGNIRVVGVKPFSPDEVKQLVEEWQQRHNDYYPGITGAWFVETDRDSDLSEVITADVIYVATRNYREDLKLVLRTPLAWWRRIRAPKKLLFVEN